MPKPSEVAVLTVNGQVFQDWETVMVRHAINEEPAYRFRFTCSEGVPLAKSWAKLRVRPGDECTVTLAGIPAIAGMVMIRQVQYNATRHHIELQGWSYSGKASQASNSHDTGEFKNVNIQQLATQLLKPLKVGFSVIGGALPNTKFDRINLQPGDTPYATLERYARALNIIGVTSNVKGDYVLAADWLPGSDAIVEGVNILQARQMWEKADSTGAQITTSQTPGNDDNNMAKVAHMPFNKLPMPDGLKGLMNHVLNEFPGGPDLLQQRSNKENQQSQVEEINVSAVVQGWLRPSGGLWERDQKVHVRSPMLILDEPMGLWVATFEQSSQAGTTTTLDLKLIRGGGGAGGKPQVQA